MNRNSPAYVIGFMVCLCAVCALAVALVYYLSLEKTAQNETMHRNRAIAKAFGLQVEAHSAAAYGKAVSLVEQTGITGNSRTWEVFIRKDHPRDVGFVFSGIGFWDRIDGIAVLSPDLSSIVNIEFLKHSETPGLGARIEEPWFTAQFKGKRIGWDRPLDERVIVGGRAPGDSNRVDGITGATQTSMAIMKTLNRSLDAFRADFKQRSGAR